MQNILREAALESKWGRVINGMLRRFKEQERAFLGKVDGLSRDCIWD